MKPTIKNIILIALTFGLSTTSLALNGQFSFHFKQLNISDGLADLTVNAITQDSLGIIYMGTANGLNIYDGNNFEHLSASNSNSLKDNTITSLFVDSKNILWIGHAQGIDTYNRRTGVIKQLSYSDGIFAVHSIFEDNNGRIWIGTHGNGLCYYDTEQEIIAKFVSKHDLYSGINDIISDNHGNLWIATEHNGLFILDPTALKLFSSKNGIDGIIEAYSLSEYRIRSMCPMPNGDIFIGTYENGIYAYKRKTKSITPLSSALTNLKSNTQIIEIISDANLNLWIATDGDGLFLYKTKQQTLINIGKKTDNTGALSSKALRSVFIDNNKTLWVTTYRGGVNYSHFLQRKKIEHFSSELLHSSVTSFEEINPERITIGTDGGGIHLYNCQNSEIQYVNNKDFTVTLNLRKSNKDELLVGTYANGLIITDNNLAIKKRLSKEEGTLNNNDIRSIVADSNNYYFATHGGGLNIYNRAHSTTKYITANYSAQSGGITHNYINTQTLDSRGFIWIATVSGLSILNTENNKILNIHAPNSSNFNASVINCIFEDSQGYIWFGTKQGLSRLKENIYNIPAASKHGNFDTNNYKFNNYLPFNKHQLIVYSIEEDSKGNLWLGTNQSLAKYSSVSHEIKTYYPETGINIDVFNPDASYKLSNGKLLFGGTQGFISFYPDSIASSILEPNVIFTYFSENNKKIDIEKTSETRKNLHQHINYTTQITITPKTKIFSLQFGSTNSYLPRKIEYAYKLEGFDKDWIYTNHFNRSASYSNLAPGKYSLAVKARYSNAEWNNNIKKIDINVLPPFYKTWLFRISILILLCLIIYAWHRTRITKLKRNNEKLAKLVNIKSRHLIEEQKAKIQELKKNKELIIEKEKAEKERLRLEKEMHQAQHENQQAKTEKLKAQLELRNKEENLIKGELSASLAQISKKNDSLQKLKNKLSQIITSDPSELQENLKQVIQKIENDMFFKDDWQKFEQHFNAVYTDFIQVLKSNYPELSRKDLRMCSYIKMNLNNKEIAQLSNITIRGVEKSRSRLRKKLNLDANDDLNAFIITAHNSY